MLGGYNIEPLIGQLGDSELAELAAEQLKHTLLMFDSFHDVADLARNGNVHAPGLFGSCAEGAWVASRPGVAEALRGGVFKVAGWSSTDGLSPASDAWRRPGTPLHALAVYQWG